MNRTIGKTDIEVYPIGLGGMPMSIQGRPDETTSIRVVHAALDAGINFIDTADVYCMDHSDIGHNEKLIGDALKQADAGARVTIATKGGLERPNGDWTRNGNPSHLRKACEASLRALDIECIDLYQLHAPDPDVPIAESAGTLFDLQSEGKIRHVGLSNVDVKEISQAMQMGTVVSVQNRCNILDRTSFDNGVIPFCEENKISFLPYCPVGGWRQRQELAEHPTLVAIASAHRSTPQEIALAWLLAVSPVILPIPGASKAKNIRSSANAATVGLTPDDLADLAEAFGA